MAGHMAGGAEIVLRLDRITKRFGRLTANDAISLALRRGEVVALLGENGAGKTTLMNILFGHYVADEGMVEVFGRPLPPGDPRAALQAGVGMVHQHFTLAEQMTVLDNITLGTMPLFALTSGRRAARDKIARLAADFGLAVDPEATISSLTVGERQRVEILKALYRDARILILDEPTAVLTPGEAAALFATLRKLVDGSLSVIFISHKLHEVMAAADRVVVLRGGRVVGEEAVANTSREKLAALMVGGTIAVPSLPPSDPGRVMLSLDNVSAALPGGRVQLRDATLALRAGEITGLAGVSGNGQAVLAALIEGMVAPSSGHMLVNDAAVRRWSPAEALKSGIARIPEDRHATGMIADMSATENVISERHHERRFSVRGLLDWAAARRFAERLIAAYEVKCPTPETRVRLLSGGNMQKLILGRALDGDPDSPPGIIIANQPTRGLDVGAVAYVQTRLVEARTRGCAVLLISEDLDEVLALADRVIVMSGGRLSAPIPRGKADAAAIGALMAGQGFEIETAGDGSAHAA
jgi:general nucleoside transport system ATP-binding protein